MVILKGILLTILAVSACLVLLTLAASLILDSTDTAARAARLRQLEKENAQLKKLLNNEIKANEELFQQIRKMRKMP